MDWFSGVVVFFIVWWTAVFVVFPWGLERDERGMPTNLRLGRKFLITTALTAVIWVVIYILVEIQLIDFHSMAARLMQENS